MEVDDDETTKEREGGRLGERDCRGIDCFASISLNGGEYGVLKETTRITTSIGCHTPSHMTSCRKKKSDDASFLADIRDHIDEFVNASMDEHKTCFKKTMQKMFGMSKIVAEKNSSANEVESILPLKTTVAD